MGARGVAVSGPRWTDDSGHRLAFGTGIGGGDGVEECAMQCVVCGATMATRPENYRYTESGLPHVILQDVAISRCPQCGETEVAIPQIEDLHRAVAHALLRKPTRLTAEEIRYLRTSLGWSSTALAAHMGTTPETVSRWQHGATPIGKTADRLLRLCVAIQITASADVLEMFPAITATTSPQAVRLRLQKDHDGWHAAAAVAAG